MSRRAGLVACVLAGTACSDSPHDYVVVTIEARPAVLDASRMKVTLSNDSSTVSEDYTLGAKTFPVTLSVSATGRTGDLGIAVEAFDEDGMLVGRGASPSTVDAATATVMIDSVDFVVNTDFAEDQELSAFTGEHGFQVAAVADGTWMTSYRDACTTPCNVLGRRFDAAGRPVTSQLAAGTNAFALSSKLTTNFSTPAVAATGTTMLAVWNASVTVSGTTTYTIECRALNASGGASSGQLVIATDEFPNLVSATPLTNGNFAVVWDGRVTTNVIRSAVVKPDCTLLGGVLQTSTVAGVGTPRNSATTASGDRILYAWILDGTLRIRIANNANTFQTPDSQLAMNTATEQIKHARAAPLPGGNFAIFTRWSLITGNTGPGRIEMLRTNNAGTVMGTPILVSDRSGSDFGSSQSFGVAAKANGTMLVVWHACEERGDGNLCGVFGRLISPAGMPVGDVFSLATTTVGDQTGPSVAALPGEAWAVTWTDNSQVDPDRSGTAVRARVIYPPTTGAN
ncbi:MAG: hypothetical protein H0X17_03145 [Deltaproteobacteria bacterium]|nr:hypothetical protein [Deltaproteobacteria bacterium]